MTVTVGLRTGSEFDQRAELRAEIAALEATLDEAQVVLRRTITPPATLGVPHLLSVAELTATRDELQRKAIAATAHLDAYEHTAERQRWHRAALDEVASRPAENRWVMITSDDVGERDCRSWQARPVLGVIGLLSEWWRVRISSGCP